MTYAIEHENERPYEADGPYRTGAYRTLDDAKAAGEQLAERGGFTNVTIRDNGDQVSISAGDLVSELIEGQWQDRNPFDVRNWWPKLDDETSLWLLDHAAEPIPSNVFLRVVAVGGVVPGTQWEGEGEYDFRLPSSAVEWIERQK